MLGENSRLELVLSDVTKCGKKAFKLNLAHNQSLGSICHI